MDCQSYAEIPPKRDYGRYFCSLARKEEPPHRGLTELTQIVQTVQKEPLVQEYSVLAGVAQRERRHSCFALDALMVVKVDIAVNHLVGFKEGRRRVAAPQRPRLSIHLASIFQADSTIRHYAFDVKTWELV